ncbi:MAG TPA: sigma-70 family RNA polymerase sigma factor [Blastocatellia bacterium]|jgi:RNA polymerase sigma-70 factor (ECF subfamily)|nr:sigma-70 family RNA polymerase sigma factor [Blastocatellia bacterium]
MATITHQAQAVELNSSRSVETASDHELLAAIRDGDEGAFGEIVRRYRNPITNFVYRMIDDYDRSVELAQETFIRIYTSASRYKADYSFSTYIYRIASNLAISELRQRKRRKLVSLFSAFSDEGGEAMELDLPDEGPLQDETLIEDERRRAVARAITSLPVKYRAAIVLRDIEGLSYDRIAETLNLSEGTVKSRINRARNLLKEKLSAYI